LAPRLAPCNTAAPGLASALLVPGWPSPVALDQLGLAAENVLRADRICLLRFRMGLGKHSTT